MKTNFRHFVAGGLVVAAALALFASPFSSVSPDGLEKVAADGGFLEKGRQPVWAHAMMPDYQLPLTREKPGALAGLAGTVLVFGAAYGIAFALVKRKKQGDGR